MRAGDDATIGGNAREEFGLGVGEGVKVDVEDGGTHGKTSLQEKGEEALGDAACVGLEPVFGEGFEGLG